MKDSDWLMKWFIGDLNDFLIDNSDHCSLAMAVQNQISLVVEASASRFRAQINNFFISERKPFSQHLHIISWLKVYIAYARWENIRAERPEIFISFVFIG